MRSASPVWLLLGLLLGFGLVLLLGSCTMVAPVGNRQPTVCEWVRAGVRDGSLRLDWATTWYPECAPFEVRR